MESVAEEKTPPVVSLAPVRRWVLKDQPLESDVKRLLQIPNLNPLVAGLLAQRGLTTEDNVRRFFSPSLADLHDPFLMAYMDKAVERINQAMQTGEKILVYGDYDVDGTTATALVYRYLSLHYTRLETYIPDRHTEGYGISSQGIDYAEAAGVALIIALDCGIKSVEKIAYARQKGIDFIICDHHLPGSDLPEAVAVLDPKQERCGYPYKELSGCGVGFKLMQALTLHNGWHMEPLLEMLDLVAVSICSDIVPITGENRIITHFGIKKLNTNASPGLQALMDLAGFKPFEGGEYKLKVDNLVFGIGPRINAAGRIGHGRGAVALLAADNPEQAMELASQINQQNQERKDLDKTITQEAIALIESSEESINAFTSVLYQPHWHKGVIGIVASRCIERYHRPTVVFTQSNGKLTGSARSIKGFDLYEAIESCSEHLIQFGGHFHAAGLTLPEENLAAFQSAFEAFARQKLTADDLIPSLMVDAEVPLDTLSGTLVKQLRRMEPFGPQNLSPLFASFYVRDSGFSRLLENKNGGNGHLKLSVTSDGCVHQGKPYAIEGIAFNMGEHWSLVHSGLPFHIVYHAEENTFNGKTTLQLMVKDIKPAD